MLQTSEQIHNESKKNLVVLDLERRTRKRHPPQDRLAECVAIVGGGVHSARHPKLHSAPKLLLGAIVQSHFCGVGRFVLCFVLGALAAHSTRQISPLHSQIRAFW